MACTKTHKEGLFDKINVERSSLSLRCRKAIRYSNSKYVGEKLFHNMDQEV